MDVTFFEHKPYFSKPEIQDENMSKYQDWDCLTFQDS